MFCTQQDVSLEGGREGGREGGMEGGRERGKEGGKRKGGEMYAEEGVVVKNDTSSLLVTGKIYIYASYI